MVFLVMEAHQELIDVLFAGISLVAMLVVIYLNYRANKMSELAIEETRLGRELEGRPYVYFNILLDQGGSVVDFCLSNHGRGVARNVRLVLEQNLKISQRREKVAVKEMAIFKPISFLAPQGAFREFADMGHIFFKDNAECEVVTGKVDYEDAGGKTYTSPVRINLKALGSKRSLIMPTMHNLVDTVEQIARVVQQKRK